MSVTDLNVGKEVVRTGADRLLSEALDIIRNKRVGILTNHTGRLADGRHIVDAIYESGIAKIVALYGPEHGIAGDAPNGVVVEHRGHPKYGIPVYSLYGKIHKPSPDMFERIDVLVCDIQDVGARFYTFISTVALAMEAAAEQGKTFIILDRPNPLRGLHFDGPVRAPSLRSFVGWMPIPVTHGLTIGELARLWNEEGWLANGVKARLEVVPMTGWKRSLWFDETGLPWIAPSPNMQSLTTAIVYPGACFVEGTSLSEGRGTSLPFLLIGAPWVDPEKVLRHLREFENPGIEFSADSFTPREIPGVAKKPKYEGEVCRGIRMNIVRRDDVRPVRLGIALLAAFKRAHPENTVFRNRRLDILTGNAGIRHQLERNVHPDQVCKSWEKDLEAFGEIREKYLMYK